MSPVFLCADGAVDGESVPSALWIMDGEALRAVDGGSVPSALGTVDGGWQIEERGQLAPE